jgi:hypothetical protein
MRIWEGMWEMYIQEDALKMRHGENARRELISATYKKIEIK